MSEYPGGPTPPRDDDPSVPPPPPAYGQPAGGVPPTPPAGGGSYPPPAYGAPADPSGAGAYPPPASPYGQPAGQPYGQPAGQPYGQPAGGYGQPYAPPPGQVDVGTAFSWAFSKFGQNWSAFVLGSLAWFAIIAVVSGIGIAMLVGAAAAGGSDSSASAALGLGASVGSVIFTAIIALLSLLFSAGVVKTAFKVADGRPVSVGDLFDTSHAGQIIVLALISGAVSVIASLIPVIGQIAALVAGFFMFYAVAALVDRGQGAVEAIRESINLQTREIGTAILVYLVVAVVAGVGILLCGVGMLVSVPVGVLIQVYAYRRLTGGQVAA